MAGLTFEGAFPRVRPFVDYQVGATLVGFVAAGDAAPVLGQTDVSLDVLPEVPGAAEGTVAAEHWAHVRLGHVFVDELVLGQVRLQLEPTLAIFE